MAQLIINRLPVPIEIQRIIKEYALLTRERKKIMELKKKICLFFRYTGHFQFVNEEDYKGYRYFLQELQFLCKTCNIFYGFTKTMFCQFCGNYKYKSNNILCRC